MQQAGYKRVNLGFMGEQSVKEMRMNALPKPCLSIIAIAQIKSPRRAGPGL